MAEDNIEASNVSKDLLRCECGCGAYGSRFRMKIITCEYFEKVGTENKKGEKSVEVRSHSGKRFWVLPQCQKPFQRELNGLMALRILVAKFENAYWFIKIFAALSVFRAQWHFVRRKQTRHQAFRHAFRTTVIFALPEKWSEWLAAKWATQPTSEPTAQATSDPESPSETSQAPC